MSIKNYLNEDGKTSPEMLAKFKATIDKKAKELWYEKTKSIAEAEAKGIETDFALLKLIHMYEINRIAATLAVEVLEKELLERYAKKG